MADRSILRDRWHQLCKDLSVSKEICQEWWEYISTHYEEPTRFYHTLTHIQELFAYRDKFSDSFEEPHLVDLAIWFHDVIYDPNAEPGRNEDDSAVIFANFVNQMTLSEKQRKKVFDWIVATKHHRSQPSDSADFRLFMDMDMAILGKSWDEYLVYTKLVKQEFSQIPQWKWCFGRTWFVCGTLNSKRIFATDEFHRAFEVRARANLTQELNQIQNDLAYTLHIPNWLSFIFISIAMLNLKTFASYIAINSIIWFLITFFTSYSFFLLGIINISILFFLLLCAPVVSFPYGQPSRQNVSVVQAGSFNPPHRGHMQVLEYLSQRFRRVYVVIGFNPNKTYLVSPMERKQLLEAAVRELNLANVTVHVWTDYIWRFASAKGAHYLVRGIRSWKQDLIEEKMLEFLNIFGPFFIGGKWPWTTMYVKANPEYASISSTKIRKLADDGKSLNNFLNPSICDEVVRLYTRAGD